MEGKKERLYSKTEIAAVAFFYVLAAIGIAKAIDSKNSNNSANISSSKSESSKAKPSRSVSSPAPGAP